MAKPIVVYYTSTSFMDVILETIQHIKNDVQLHLFVEISPQNMNSTIINVASLEGLQTIEEPERVLGKAQWALFKDYVAGLAEVKFVVHPKKQSFSLNSLRVSFTLGRYLKKLKADIIHFDTISPRAIGLYPYLRNRNVLIALHDPLPHTGEYNWKEDVPMFVFFRLAKGFVFYSAFATTEFRKHHPKYAKVPVHTIHLYPYTFTRHFSQQKPVQPEHVLFFGRLSYYKGIDILINGLTEFFTAYPNEKVVIAGKPAWGYEVDLKPLGPFASNVTLVTRFLTTEELVNWIERSKFIVCPYREATQSGVLMTSFALGKPVVATKVGSFPEYIQEGKNGLLCEPEPSAVAQAMIQAIDHNRYETLARGVEIEQFSPVIRENRATLLAAYAQIRQR